MATTPPDPEAAAELAEAEEKKEDAVLEREPLETKLMDEERSEVGEEVEGVEDE
jgi:hypothetical protein